MGLYLVSQLALEGLGILGKVRGDHQRSVGSFAGAGDQQDSKSKPAHLQTTVSQLAHSLFHIRRRNPVHTLLGRVTPIPVCELLLIPAVYTVIARLCEAEKR